MTSTENWLKDSQDKLDVKCKDNNGATYRIYQGEDNFIAKKGSKDDW